MLAYASSTDTILASKQFAAIVAVHAFAWLCSNGLGRGGIGEAEQMTRVSDNGWILIVDDDEDTREFLHDLLVSEGYRVRASRGGEEALRQLAAPIPPSVLLLDIHMPAMDGWA